MTDDSYEELAEQEFDITGFPLDSIAARCESYTHLVTVAAKLTDAELRREALMMLSSIRRSFHTLPTGELSTIKGGKGN